MSIDVGVLTFFCAYLVAWSVRAVYRLARGRAANSITGVGAVVLWVGLLAVCGYHEVRHHVVQAAATQVTREVSGNPAATVTCQRAAHDMVGARQDLGFVSWDDSSTAVLRPSTCANLGAWMWGGRGASDERQVVAVHVVTHEAVHVGGVYDESRTECIAMSRDAHVAQMLGASPEQADAIALAYRSQVYPHMRDEYRTDCDALDLDTQDGSSNPTG